MDLSNTIHWKDRLRQERIQHSWRQREVAEHLGTTVLTITRWERGTHHPSAYFRAKLCVLFGKSAEELGFIQDPSPSEHSPIKVEAKPAVQLTPPSTGPDSIWAIPHLRNPFFTGREEVLQRLHTQINQKQTTTLTQSWAFSGLGGIGKTQVALEYAYRYRDAYRFVFWSSAATRENLLAGITTIADLLQLPERDEQDQKKIITAVKQWLATHNEWLWIIDNADDIVTVQDVISTELSGHLLLTSRAQALGALAQRIDIETMGLAEAVLFLLRRARLLAPDASLSSTPEEQLATAEAIALQMDFLPLALDQAGAYIEEVGCSLSAYLDIYRTHRKELLQRRGNIFINHPESVITTWSLAFAKVEQSNRAAADFLQLCAFLEPDTIPEELIREGNAYLGPLLQKTVVDPLLFNNIIEELRKFSLVQCAPETKLLRIHRLVQAVIKDSLEPEEQRQWATRAVNVTNTVFPGTIEKETWPLCRRFLSQAQACSILVQDYQLNFPEAAELLHRTATYLRTYATLYEQSEALYRQAMQIQELVLDEDHPDRAQPLVGLANLYTKQGKYAQAEPLFLQARRIWEQSLPPDHPEMASLCNAMAIVYWQQGKSAEAELLYQRALQIWKHALGPEHLKTTYPLNNLALVYHQQGKYEQAELLYKQTLSILEKNLGPEHVRIAPALNNLANIYEVQGQNTEAELLYQRALQIWEHALGPEHPDITYPLNNLANLYQDQGKYIQSEVLYKRALRIQKQTLGPEHPLLASTTEGLANLYRKQQKYEEALALFQQVQRIRELVLDPEHPDLAETFHDFARLRADLGDYQEAAALYRRALAIREKVYGSQHKKTHETRESLQMVLSPRSGQNEAKPKRSALSSKLV